MSLQPELEFALAAARAAGAIALRFFQTELDVRDKSDGSPVTIADQQIETHLRSLIRNRFPGDGILGEEQGEEPGRSGRRWVIDPIDGTVAFARGVPMFGVLIALEDKGQPALGVLHMPALGEMAYATLGQGAWWIPRDAQAGGTPRPARVSTIDRLRDSLVLLASFEYFAHAGREAQFLALARAGRMRGWTDCYAHLLVATGRAEVMVEPGMALWDSAALVPIVCEAGGTFTDWQGGPTAHGTSAIASNSRVLAETLALVQR